MEKFTREITFEGINEEIKETLEELGYSNINYLEDFCNENNFELIIKTQSYKQHSETCLVGWNDAETSENISDALLSLYECNYTDDNDLIYDIYIDNGNEQIFVKTLEIKDYTELVIVDEHGIETDPYSNDFIDAIISKVDESLNNGNLQTTTLYKSIFKTQEDIENDEKYNTNYNYLIERVTISVKNYMLEDTEHRFDADVSKHFMSCYFFYEVPTIRDYYSDDISDVLSYKDL